MVVRTLLDTTHESSITYTRHTVANSDRGQARTIVERLISNALHIIP